MIDIASETTLSLTQAARLLPPGRRGQPVTLSCLLRWVLEGAKAPDGARVRLEALRVGGRWITSREAIQRFAVALTPRAADGRASEPRPPRSGAVRAKGLPNRWHGRASNDSNI
jgi:hypothetical protein